MTTQKDQLTSPSSMARRPGTQSQLASSSSASTMLPPLPVETLLTKFLSLNVPERQGRQLVRVTTRGQSQPGQLGCHQAGVHGDL